MPHSAPSLPSCRMASSAFTVVLGLLAATAVQAVSVTCRMAGRAAAVAAGHLAAAAPGTTRVGCLTSQATRNSLAVMRIRSSRTSCLHARLQAERQVPTARPAHTCFACWPLTEPCLRCLQALPPGVPYPANLKKYYTAYPAPISFLTYLDSIFKCQASASWCQPRHRTQQQAMGHDCQQRAAGTHRCVGQTSTTAPCEPVLGRGGVARARRRHGGGTTWCTLCCTHATHPKYLLAASALPRACRATLRCVPTPPASPSPRATPPWQSAAAMPSPAQASAPGPACSTARFVHGNLPAWGGGMPSLTERAGSGLRLAAQQAAWRHAGRQGAYTARSSIPLKGRASPHESLDPTQVACPAVPCRSSRTC